WLNRRVFLPRLAARLVKAGPRPHVALVTLPTRAPLDLLDLLRPDLVIYVCYLNFGQDPLAPHDIAQTEGELVRRADVVIVDQGIDNQERIARCEPARPVVPYTATVSYDAFASARQPKLHSGPPRCAYFGDLSPSIDVDLLRRVSERYPLR